MADETTQEQTPEELAYEAGYRLPSVQWPEFDEDDRRDPNVLLTPGVHHNPFDGNRSDQRAEYVAWLKGLRDRLDAPQKNPEEIVADINAELDDE